MDTAFDIANCPDFGFSMPESGSRSQLLESCHEGDESDKLYAMLTPKDDGNAAVEPWYQNDVACAKDEIRSDTVVPSSISSIEEPQFMNILKRDLHFNFIDMEAHKVDDDSLACYTTECALSCVFEDDVESDDESSVGFDECTSRDEHCTTAEVTSDAEDHVNNDRVNNDHESALSSSSAITTITTTTSSAAFVPLLASTSSIPRLMSARNRMKNRVVDSAQRLVSDENDLQTDILPQWFPFEGAPNATKIRLIQVYQKQNATNRLIGAYIHAADLGSVVERKSNISRLFGKFESPSQKLLLRVVGTHNHTIGQEANVLTSNGVKRFLGVPKMQDAPSGYAAWIQNVLLPVMSCHDSASSILKPSAARNTSKGDVSASRASQKKRSARSQECDEDEEFITNAKRHKHAGSARDR